MTKIERRQKHNTPKEHKERIRLRKELRNRRTVDVRDIKYSVFTPREEDKKHLEWALAASRLQ